MRTATAQDIESIRTLLTEADLPTSDLISSQARFVVVHDGRKTVGTGALQFFGRVALLRSLAVSPEQRRSGVGKLIVHELERRARSAGIESLVLLTQTAEQFFAGLGYSVIDRRDAPHSVHESDEFKSLCPASAVCMSKPVTPPTGN